MTRARKLYLSFASNVHVIRNSERPFNLKLKTETNYEK